MRVLVVYTGEGVELEVSNQTALSSLIELACSSLHAPGESRNYCLFLHNPADQTNRLLTAQVRH
jgi:hypothetical protein